MNSAPGIILTRGERTKLEALATGPRVNRALAKRAQAILACAEGSTNLVVASEIGVTNLTLGRWRREFLLNRLKGFGVERRGRPVRPLVLSPAERRTLQGWSRSPRLSACLSTRARVILACAGGKSNKAVALATGMSQDAVGDWRGRFLLRRLKGLRPEPLGRPMAPVVLSPNEQMILKTWSRSPEFPSAMARRATVILACADGKSNAAVAQETSLPTEAVGKLRRRFLARRINGLKYRRQSAFVSDRVPRGRVGTAAPRV